MKPLENAVAHGGDLGEAMRRDPDAPHPWLDLSTGINPVPYPLPDLPADAWTRLPSRAGHDALIEAAAARYGVKDLSTIVAAPGTQALIQLLPRLWPRSKVAVVGPTYEEHEVSWRRQGHTVRIIGQVSEAQDDEVLIVVNPDNPTGRVMPASQLREPRQLTVVDEAFADFLPNSVSFAGDLPDNAIVLKSFGKAYGLGGVRLGFAVAGQEVAARLRDELGPWAVSGPALEIGRAALSDEAWLKQTASRLAGDARRLDELLKSAGFTPLGGTPLFRLVRHDDAPGMVRQLGRYGIHVRAFSFPSDRLRFGLPGTDADFGRLATALAGFR
jgi:cobalamin biosynthetic protein CobC